jgi:hypothetical protein
MSALERLHKKTRLAAETKLGSDEEVITIFSGRSKQALIVTDRQVLIVKPGSMAGAALGAKATSFPFQSITRINLHTGPGFAALEVVAADYPASDKPDLRAAYQLPNWLACHRSMGESPLIGELRTYVRSGGQSQPARTALSDAHRTLRD